MELTAKRKCLGEVKKKTEKDLRVKFAITISICYCDDATKPHTREMHCRIQTYQIVEKINHLMYMDNIKRFAKKESELETPIQIVRIIPQDMEYGKKRAMLIMKNWKRRMTEGMDLPNLEKIRTLEEKKMCKYLVILVVDTIKQVEMKEQIIKSISEEKATQNQTI